MEVMVVTSVGAFIPRSLSRQINRANFAGINEDLEVSVDSRDSQGWLLYLRCGEDLRGEEWSTRQFNRVLNGIAPATVPALQIGPRLIDFFHGVDCG